MKMCFSTLACPTWTLDQAVEIAVSSGYDAIELRFLEGEDSLWKFPAFQGAALQTTRRMLADRGLAVACVDTSCRFHSPDLQERKHWLEEGVRMAELAAALGAPGIRVVCHVSLREGGRPGGPGRVRRKVPDGIGPGQVRSRRHYPRGGAAGRRVPHGAHHRTPA